MFLVYLCVSTCISSDIVAGTNWHNVFFIQKSADEKERRDKKDLLIIEYPKADCPNAPDSFVFLANGI